MRTCLHPQLRNISLNYIKDIKEKTSSIWVITTDFCQFEYVQLGWERWVFWCSKNEILFQPFVLHGEAIFGFRKMFYFLAFENKSILKLCIHLFRWCRKQKQKQKHMFEFHLDEMNLQKVEINHKGQKKEQSFEQSHISFFSKLTS